MKTISRLYKDYDTGARVVDELERAGIPHDDISIVANNESGWFDRDGTTSRVDRDHDRDTTAATIGPKAPLPGPVLEQALAASPACSPAWDCWRSPALGPLSRRDGLPPPPPMAAAGGTAGGLIGALTQAGHDENEARTYAEGVQHGGTLVTVRVDDSRAATAEAIMQRYDDRTEANTTGTAYREGTTDTAYREDWSGDRIVAVFENTERAATAREALIGDGIDNARMELIDRRSDLDNWAAMKRHALPDEDTHLFAESLGRGHAILVIRAASGEHDRIMQVLSRFNPIDIEEHAQQWRTPAGRGVHPGKAAWDVHRQERRLAQHAITTGATTAPTTATTAATGAPTLPPPRLAARPRCRKR